MLFGLMGSFGVGVGSLVLLANIILLSFYTFSCHSLGTSWAAKSIVFRASHLVVPRHTAWRGASFLNEHHMLFAWLSLFSVGLADLIHSTGCIGCNPGFETAVSEKYETHEHDVLIIGAGGAGLRAAIEALAQGASVGVVCKSLLGKAHTVMAEGGIAAAMANVDQADDWRTHFRDTMRGGKFLNNWRMAQMHAQESPEQCSRIGTVGRAF